MIQFFYYLWLLRAALIGGVALILAMVVLDIPLGVSLLIGGLVAAGVFLVWEDGLTVGDNKQTVFSSTQQKDWEEAGDKINRLAAIGPSLSDAETSQSVMQIVGLMSNLHSRVAADAQSFRQCRRAFGSFLDQTLDVAFKLNLNPNGTSLVGDGSVNILKTLTNLERLLTEYVDRLDRGYQEELEVRVTVLENQIAQEMGYISPISADTPSI